MDSRRTRPEAQQVPQPVEQPAPQPQEVQQAEVQEQPVAEASAAPSDGVTVELQGGDTEDFDTQYGTFVKGQTVEVSREMADQLLQLTGNDGEPLFREV